MKEIDPESISFYTVRGQKLIKFKESVPPQVELLAQFCFEKIERSFPYMCDEGKKAALVSEYKIVYAAFFGDEA